MIRCDRVEELLGAWLDGELSPAQAAEVQAHVDGCSGCMAQKRDLESLDFQIKRALAGHAPALALQPFWAAARYGVEEAEAPQNSPWRERVPSSLGGFSLAWAVPAVIALLLVV